MESQYFSPVMYNWVTHTITVAITSAPQGADLQLSAGYTFLGTPCWMSQLLAELTCQEEKHTGNKYKQYKQ